MANRYTAAAIGIPYLPFKSMMAIYNGTGSGKILKIWKIWILNNQSVAVNGVLTQFQILRITSLSGGNPITPTKHNSSLPSIPTEVLASTGATVATSDLIERIYFSADEPVATAGNNNNWGIIPNMDIYKVDDRQSLVEPIVCREGFGITVTHIDGSFSVGAVDIFLEFTIE